MAFLDCYPLCHGVDESLLVGLRLECPSCRRMISLSSSDVKIPVANIGPQLDSYIFY